MIASHTEITIVLLKRWEIIDVIILITWENLLKFSAFKNNAESCKIIRKQD